MFIVFGWVFVGLLVAAVEKRMRPGRDTDETMVTVLCIAGAVAVGFIGQTFRWYVFGEPLGFVCSAAGAEVLLFIYRARNVATRSGGAIARPASVVTPNNPVGFRFLKAFVWGALCGLALGTSGVVGLIVGSRLYPMGEHLPVEVLFIPIGLIVGFVLGGIARLMRPHWTAVQMFLAIVSLAIASAAFIVHLYRVNPLRLPD